MNVRGWHAIRPRASALVARAAVARCTRLAARCAAHVLEKPAGHAAHAVMSDIRSCLFNSPTTHFVCCVHDVCCERLILPGDARLAARGIWRILKSSDWACLARLRRSVDEGSRRQIGHALKRTTALVAQAAVARYTRLAARCAAHVLKTRWTCAHTRS